jgi:hypothetical protein
MFGSDAPEVPQEDAKTATPGAADTSDIDITVDDETDTVRLRTTTLAQVKHPELELADVPKARAEDGARVLDVVARYVAKQHVVAAGELLEIRGPRAALVVGLAVPPDEGKKKKGFFSRLIGGKPEVLRLVEPDESMEHPKTLLSTMSLWRAVSAVAEDEHEVAKELMLDSVKWFPGDPKRRDAPQLGGASFNWENHLAYAMLARLDQENAVDWLDKALSRADTFELDRLGDTAEELAAESRGALIETLGTVLDYNLHHYRVDDEAPGVSMISSPIWLHGVGSQGEPLADRTVSVLPTPFANYYYKGEVAERLASDTELHELLASVVSTHAKKSPARLGMLVDEIRAIYESAEDGEMFDEHTPRYVMGMQILSLLAADAGRRLAAGLTLGELRVLYGLKDDADKRDKALAKMAKLAEAEHEAFLATMEDDQVEEGDDEDEDDAD